jgi:hypothetical protein
MLPSSRMELASIEGTSVMVVSRKERIKILFWVEIARAHRSPVVAS